MSKKSKRRAGKAPESKQLGNPLGGLFDLFGLLPTVSGSLLSAEQAIAVPAVSSAMRVISEAVACLDVSVKEIGADGREVAVEGHPALALLRDAANDWTSGFEFLRDLVVDALTDDRGGLAYVNRASNGELVELVRYNAAHVQVDYHPATFEPRYRLEDRPVAPENMIHLRAPFGRAPLTLAREAIAVAAALERHAANLFGKGARPSGALMFPKGMGEDAVLKARAAWRATHEADGETGRTAILYDGTEFKPFTFTSTDAQFLENRNFQVIEIARAFRVPPSMLFDLSRATWSNTEQMGKEFLTYCLEPWLRAVEGALRRALFPAGERERLVIRFDRDDLTRADLSTRATVINSLIASETINPNEGRSWIGLEAYPGGETFGNRNITTDTKPGDTPAQEDAPEDDAAL